jgi:exodeoxyribonuclease-5
MPDTEIEAEAKFELSETQKTAIDSLVDWFKNRTDEQQVFRIFGYAGTGKTTITKAAIEALGLSMGGPLAEVRFCAFTGKASYVMRRHGTPAQTIHSLFYAVHEATDAEIEEAKAKLAIKEQEAKEFRGAERMAADIQIQELRNSIKEMKQPKFRLNLESEARDAKLIVLDEVSMVGPEMAADILSFDRPVLVLGDPGQLPPIKGEGAFTMQDPDIMLTEVHRQALDSAIIRLATMARLGQPIPYGRHSDLVWKLAKTQMPIPQLLKADQVICGRNRTRLELNWGMRQAAGFPVSQYLPTGPEEKVICLRNMNDVGLINGMFIELEEIEFNPERPEHFRAKVKKEDGSYAIRSDSSDPVFELGEADEGTRATKFRVYTGHFEDHTNFDPDRNDKDYRIKKGMVEATYGWAITCHKSQGSQWRNVIVYDDHLTRREGERRKWLYTALTRAEEGLLILD